uniref:T-box domain-containing protein n=1 Tax=Heterorhabditis bacteriophora TaxID=37862 RepID=A0A1I7XCL8_HETBA
MRSTTCWDLRRMFPTLSVSLSGLDANAFYSLMVDLECVDNKRYRYSFHQSKWTATGPGEAELPCRTFVHPESPSSGAHWMKTVISFDKIKLTNNQLDQNGHVGNIDIFTHLQNIFTAIEAITKRYKSKLIIVNSMHRYRPRIHLVRHIDGGGGQAAERRTISFEETAFIAVTAYQNHRITSLKIESNPFAKGFRECELDDPRLLPFIIPFYNFALPLRKT